MRSQHPVLLVLVLLLLTTRGASEAPFQEQPAGDDPSVFRIETRLVQVDVVVKNDAGPVDDLTIDDFTIYDDGAARALGYFEVTRAAVPAASDPEPAVASPIDRVSTNRPASQSARPNSATILFLDRLNTDVLDQPRANRQALEFLTSMDGSQSVAVYELQGTLRLIQDYTSDREQLIRAASRFGITSSTQLDASFGANATGGFEAVGNEVGIDPDLVDQRTGGGIEERGTSDLDQMVAAYYVNNRIRVTSDVLEALATNMGGLPGRKNLVWISGRFPFSFEPTSSFMPEEISDDTLERLRHTARVITDANVAVYPISAVGLLAPTFNDPSVSQGASRQARGRARFSRSISTSPDRLTTEPDSTNSMREIAEMTGGKAVYLTNGLAGAIGEVVADSEVIYALGFYPDVVDGDFHELRVEVARDDVEVRHRRGYYGFLSPAGGIDAEPGSIRTLVTSPVNATAVGIRAIRDDGSTLLRIDLNDLEMDLQDEIWYGAVEIATLLVEDAGEPPNVQVGNMVIAVTEEQRETVDRSGGYELFRIGRDTPAAAWFRVVVRDLVSGSAGSLWVVLDP